MSHVVVDPANIKIDKLFIRKNNDKTVTVHNLTGATKVKELKDILVKQEGKAFEKVILAFGGKQISEKDDEKILADFGIKNGSLINVIFRVLGGMNDEGAQDNAEITEENEKMMAHEKYLQMLKTFHKVSY